jgi:glyoxylase-like metal-dependent hydrolase (beta-lactamase superfamily II)
MTEATSNTITIGDVEITRVDELMLPTSIRWLLPDASGDVVERAFEWLKPQFMNDDGYLLQSIHTFVVRASGLTILVDTGVGNDKPRGGRIPAFNMLSTPFIQRLADAGVEPNEVDFVLCTHVHGDHVGWNTTLVDGEWVPTFPNARYLCARPEWEYWTSIEGEDATQQLLDDSMYPIRDAGLLDLVATDHRICDEVWLEPSHGHSPGHVSVCIESAGASAVMIGDALHSPLQCAVPELRPALDRDEVPAREARLALLDRYADSGTLVFGAHFAAPSAGLVSRDGNAFKFTAYTP